MVLTKENYYSKEADWEYMSYSQYKGFMQCQAKELAKLKGEFTEETKDCFLQGSMLHAWNEGTLEQFKKENIDKICYAPKKDKNGVPLPNQKRELLAAFQLIEVMINTLAKDDLIMYCLEGKKEQILTAKMFGVMWKGAVDVFRPDANIEIKTCKSIYEKQWNDQYQEKVSFIENYGYLTQAAIYCELRRIMFNEPSWVESIMIAVTKDKVPDKAIISLKDDNRFNAELAEIKTRLPGIMAVKNGEAVPKRCEKCDYCKSTKQLSGLIHYKNI